MFKKDKEKKQEETNPFVEENISEEAQKSIEQEAELPEEATDSEADKIKAEMESLKSQYVRLAADFDNYRKRQAQEREALLKYGAEDTLKKLLPVLDTFNRANKSLEEAEEIEQLKESFDVVQKQFLDAIEKLGLKKIETVGVEFDPNMHEAVMQTQTNDHPDHSIVGELQSGYMLDDRVLRAAMVNVAVNE